MKVVITRESQAQPCSPRGRPIPDSKEQLHACRGGPAASGAVGGILASAGKGSPRRA